MKKIMKIGLICVMVLMFVACTAETKVDEDGGEDKETVVTTDMMKVVIGRGYDVTGRYAYSPEIKEAIMDYNKLSADDKIICDNNSEKSTFSTYSGNTITNYQNDLAVSAKISAGGGVEGVAYFGGEAGFSFGQSRYKSDEYAFATSTSKITKKSYFVDGKGSPAKLSNYLTSSFKEDVDSLTAGAITGDEFIKKYGTHVMLGGIWGARLDYHMSAKKSVEDVKSQIGAYAKAKAEVTYGVGSGSVETEVATDTAYAKYFETGSVEVQTIAYGGSSEYARGVHDNGEYDGWIESIADNPIWCDYYPDTLIPIYNLFENETIKQVVKTAYDNYLKGKIVTVESSEIAYTVEMPFELVGFTNRVGGKDSDIGTEKGKHTQWEYSIELREDAGGTNIIADIMLWVKEESSNYTVLSGKKSYTVNVNKNISSIDLTQMSYGKKSVCGSKDETTTEIFDKNHGWNQRKAPDCQFLKDGVYLKIDGDGDDEQYVGIKGTFVIPIHYKK